MLHALTGVDAYAGDLGQLYLRELWLPSALLALLGIVLWWALVRVTRTPPGALSYASAFWILCFSYGPFHRALAAKDGSEDLLYLILYGCSRAGPVLGLCANTRRVPTSSPLRPR